MRPPGLPLDGIIKFQVKALRSQGYLLILIMLLLVFLIKSKSKEQEQNGMPLEKTTEGKKRREERHT